MTAVVLAVTPYLVDKLLAAGLLVGVLAAPFLSELREGRRR